MLSVGLTGGLASGKSSVGQILARLGCYVIRMDDLGHQAIAPGGSATAAVIARFGHGIQAADGSIDRRRLGEIVFPHPEELAALNALIHPLVRAQSAALRDSHFRDHPHGIVVTEAAILIETGSYRDFDCLVVAVCRPEQQIERAMTRDGLSRDQVIARLSRQLPIADKVKLADFVVDTSGSRESTEAQVRAVYDALNKRATAANPSPHPKREDLLS